MLLQLSRRAKSEHVKLRAIELVMIHDGYDLSVLSNSPSGRAGRQSTRKLSDLDSGELADNQQDGIPVDSVRSFGLKSLEKAFAEQR